MNADDIIYSYTRAQAIADGILVDITQQAKETGFKIPVAVTAELYGHYLNPIERAKDMGQTLLGRIHDLLTTLYYTIKVKPNDSLIFFTVSFLMDDEHFEKPTFKCVIDGGDDGKPVLTIMLKNQD